MAILWIGVLVKGTTVSTTDISIIISAITLFLSLGGSAFIAGYRWGGVKTRLEIMEKSLENSATKEQLSGVKEDVAEIKGMFRMSLKDGPS